MIYNIIYLRGGDTIHAFSKRQPPTDFTQGNTATSSHLMLQILWTADDFSSDKAVVDHGSYVEILSSRRSNKEHLVFIDAALSKHLSIISRKHMSH